MPVRLTGGYEMKDTWRGVRDAAPEIMAEWGVADWTVTIGPLTAAQAEQADAAPGDAFVRIDVEAKQMEMLGLEDIDVWDDESRMPNVEKFIEWHICDQIDQALNPDDDEDWNDDE